MAASASGDWAEAVEPATTIIAVQHASRNLAHTIVSPFLVTGLAALIFKPIAYHMPDDRDNTGADDL
jgi:hypothetical protein